ncbi:hypothetical protein [Flavobacterium sp. 3HN19-14]|uniref:hypothetical protein n=1 Tax=Flavobacterium sp. 3HN19-14 TaxID=3448133 RepID=UPI003EE1EBC6
MISLFSNAYTNVPVDTWHTSWSDATLEDVQVAGNDTKKYTSLNFVGIETVASEIDATNMDYLNIDVWSPNFTVFKVKLVDFGANMVYDGREWVTIRSTNSLSIILHKTNGLHFTFLYQILQT